MASFDLRILPHTRRLRRCKDKLLDWPFPFAEDRSVSTLIAQYGLVIVALINFAGEIGLPTLVPGEIALLIAGNQVIHSVALLIGAIVLFAAVDLVATSTIHIASRTGGNRLLSCLLRMTCRTSTRPEAVFEKCRRRLGGHDPVVVFVTRLIPVFRLYASIGAGLIRIRFRHFIIGAAPAALVWAATPLICGYLLRSQVGSMVSQYPAILRYIMIVSAGAIAIGVCLGWLRHAGGRDAALRRARFILGVVAVGGALARVLNFVFQEHGIAGRYVSLPFAPRIFGLGNPYRPGGSWASLGRWT
jgi:membrane protein DedA with SNARE-associated domain